MLLECSVLYLVHLVKLPLKDYEIFSCLRINVEKFILDRLEGICYLKEVLLGEEELKISVKNLLLKLIKGDHNSVLLEVLLEGVV